MRGLRDWQGFDWPDWWVDGVLRFLKATDLLEPMERLVRWLNARLSP